MKYHSNNWFPSGNCDKDVGGITCVCHRFQCNLRDTTAGILPRGPHFQKITGSIPDFEDLLSTLITSNAFCPSAFMITLTFQESPRRPCPGRAGCGHAKGLACSSPCPQADPVAAEARSGQGGVEPHLNIKRGQRRRHLGSAGEEGKECGAGRGGRGPWERLAGEGTARGGGCRQGRVRARLGKVKPAGNR